MEEMLGRLGSFSITEEEATVIGIPDDVIEKSRKEASFGLLGKVLSSKPFNKGSVMSTMIKLWAADGDLSAQVIDRDIFLFSFKKEQDRARVLAMEPWSFNKSLILLKVVNGDEILRWDNWSFTCFWIRVYNLPYDGMIREIGEKIGNGIGKFLDVVTDRNGRCSGLYMRLRVQIDVSKPLRRGATVQLGSNGAKVWTSFKYERVPDFCFGCGRIGHGRLECVDARVRNVNAPDRLFYSAELRADVRSERSLWSRYDGTGRGKDSSGRSERLPGTGNMDGGRREGSSSRSDGPGGVQSSGPVSQKTPSVNQPSRMVANYQETPIRKIPDSRESDLSKAPNLQRDSGAPNMQRDSGVGFNLKMDSINLNKSRPENVAADDMKSLSHVHGMKSLSHVHGTTFLSKTVCFGDSPNDVECNVDSPSPKLDILIPNLGSMHGTAHVERSVADGIIFSAGMAEPVKRCAGKWKKEARLKGASGKGAGGVGSSSLTTSMNVKRKIGLDSAVGVVTKVRKTDGSSLVAADSAEAVAQPRQSQ